MFGFRDISFLTELHHVFSCQKRFLNIAHIRKSNSTFLYTFLYLFMISTCVRLFHYQKILITESGARQSSNWGNFCQIFFGRQVNQ